MIYLKLPISVDEQRCQRAHPLTPNDSPQLRNYFRSSREILNIDNYSATAASVRSSSSFFLTLNIPRFAEENPLFCLSVAFHGQLPSAASSIFP